MDLIKVRDKYHKNIKFFESKQVLNENHIHLIIKGLYGIKVFIVDNNELFEPVAIEWLDVYCNCRHKFDEDLFQKSVFFTTHNIIKILILRITSTLFVNDVALRLSKILCDVPSFIFAQTFKDRLSTFKMLSTKIFGCGIYSHQVTMLEILFRFFSEYRNYEFENNQNNTPILVLDELFPDIIKKHELKEIFLNIQKSSFVLDSRNFLNVLNRCVEPCKIFSIVAESIEISEIKLKVPILSNKPYQFWIDFNIDILQMSFPCKGDEYCENDWLTNLIAKEDIEQIIVERNATNLSLFIYLKKIFNLSSTMLKFDLNLSPINFTFILNEETMYLIENIIPYYQSALNSNSRMLNELTPIEERTITLKHDQSSITPEIESNKSVNKPFVISDITYKTIDITSANVKSLNNQQENITVPSRAKNTKRTKKNPTNKINSKLSQKKMKKPKTNEKATIISKRKLYTKEVIDYEIPDTPRVKKKRKERKLYKSRRLKKLVNQIEPLEGNDTKSQSKLLSITQYTKWEMIKIQANIDLINSGIQYSDCSTSDVTALIELSPVNNILPFNDCIVPEQNSNDIENIRLNETRDDELVLNVASQAISEQTQLQAVQLNKTKGYFNKDELVPLHTSTPLNKQEKPVYNKKKTRNYYLDDIEPYTEYYSKISLQQPLHDQDFCPSKSKPQSFCEHFEHLENILVVEVHALNHNDTSSKEVNLSIKTQENITNLPEINHVASVPNTIGLELNVDSNDIPNNTSIKQSKNQNIAQKSSESMPMSIGLDLRTEYVISVSDDIDYKNTKPDPIPLVNSEQSLYLKLNTLKIGEVETSFEIDEKLISQLNFVQFNHDSPFTREAIQSIEVDSQQQLEQCTLNTVVEVAISSEINEESILMLNSEQSSVGSPVSQIETQFIGVASQQNSKQCTLNTIAEVATSSEINERSISMLISKKSNLCSPVIQRETQSIELGSQLLSEIDDRPKQNLHNKRSAVDHSLNDIVSYSPCNNIITQIHNTLLETSVEVNRDTISVDTTNDLSIGLQNQLQLLNTKLTEVLENELNSNEILKELQNCKKARVDNEESLKLLVETKTQKLSKKQKKLISDLEMIQQLENELKESYVNLFKNLEKVKRSVNRNRDAIYQEKKHFLQIKKHEYELTKRLIKDIIGRSKNIRDNIWRQYILDFGHNFQQELYERYLD